MRQIKCYTTFALGVLFLALCAEAHTTMHIWPRVAPGSDKWTWHEKIFHNVSYKGVDIGTVYEDIVTPTLTLYLPPQDKTTGTGIIIAAGGGCLALTIRPALETAHWLEGKGVAAFVLKYRLQRKIKSGPLPANLNEDVACKWADEDGLQAIKVVRKHAALWGVSPHRIGFMGFSAGGYISSRMLTAKNPADRPDFVGLFYGAPFESMPAIPVKLPADFENANTPLPPVYMSWAQDDQIAASAMLRFFNLLVSEHYKPEAHIYYAGGHGFTLVKHSDTSQHWLQEFYWWLRARGFTKPEK